MKRYFIITFIGLILFSCTEDSYFSQNTKGVEIYLDKNIPITGMINPQVFESEETPFITYDEIISYDSASHVIEFSRNVNTLFYYWNNHDGRGFGICLDDSIIFCGVLWSPIHSDPNPNIVLTTPIDNNSDGTKLQLFDCYPSGYFQTEDRIKDELIIERFKKDGKLVSY